MRSLTIFAVEDLQMRAEPVGYQKFIVYEKCKAGGTDLRQRFVFSYCGHVMLIPQAAFFYRCFGAQICVFHEFHTPGTSETQLLQHHNVLGQKLVRNSRFQQKHVYFFKMASFCKIWFTESQISRCMCSAVQNQQFDFSEFAENARQCIIFS